MSIQNDKLDKLFSSLSDPTRRAILQRTKHGAVTVLELASDFKMSIPAVSKHINVLVRTGLLKKTRTGRFTYCSFDPSKMLPAINWLNNQYEVWNSSFKKLSEYLEEQKET